MISKPQFKEEFIKRYSTLTDFDIFKKFSLEYLRRSIRINTLKISVKELKERLENKGWSLEPIKWCKEGFFIHNPSRRDIGNTIEHSLGYFYVQEAASMIPPLTLNNPKNKIILDMCASPGSKTTQLGMYMKNTGLVIANDYQLNRLKPLGLNIQRSGLTNTIITLMPGQLFRYKKIKFDAILLDVPCSGTGAIRKSLKTLKIWNPNMIKRLARIQKQLLESAFLSLKDSGIIIYSTCSLEPEENEANISWLVDKYKNILVEKINIHGLKTSKPIMEFDSNQYNSQIRRCLRIWPQDNDTEGFFVAKLRKQ